MRRVRHRHDDGVQAKARRLGKRADRMRNAVAGCHAGPNRRRGINDRDELEAGAVLGQRDRVRGLANESRTNQSHPQRCERLASSRSCIAFRVQATTYVPARGRAPHRTLERSYCRATVELPVPGGQRFGRAESSN